MAQSNTRRQLEEWLSQIDVKGSVLDIGGAQHNIKGRTKSWKVTNYKILDLEQPHQGNQPDIIFDINSRNEIDDAEVRYLERPEWGYDNIFCIEVMEYIFNPLDALLNMNELLIDGGLLYISFHFIYPEHLPIGLDMLRYTSSGVVKLLEETGFTIIENIPRTLKDNFSRDILVSMYVNEGMRGWRDFDVNIIGNLIKARKI